LVALAYSQVARVDFHDHFSPVLSDTSFRVVLVIIYKLKLEAWSLDVETEFLVGKFLGEIFMKISEGYEELCGKSIKGKKC
jgi:Reverse transcriptase (RNA-dependent DNA polymerase)